MRNVVGVILGGGRGERLRPLTGHRAKPAVPFAGTYRLVDIPISNCLHAGIERIYVLTQYRSASLNRHVAQTYRFDVFSTGFAEVLAAEQTEQGRAESGWYEGTADAVRKQLHHLAIEEDGDVVILSGDQVYFMDLGDLVRRHRAARADVTVAATRCTRDDSRRFGVMKVDESLRITEFAEKPQDDPTIDRFCVPEPQGDKTHLASMGIYVFRRAVLADLLERDRRDDFGKHLLPSMLGEGRLFAYPYTGFWEDVGTIASYHTVNLHLTDPVPELDLFQATAPLYTRPRFLPPAKICDAQVRHALLGNGAVIGNGSRVTRCVIGIRTIIAPGCSLEECVVNGSGDYDFHIQRNHGEPRLGVGEGSILRRAIVDRDARIGSGVRLVNERGLEEYQDAYITVRDGIIVVPARGVVPSGYVF